MLANKMSWLLYKTRRLKEFMRDVLVDASINFDWLPTVTICLYVQINEQLKAFIGEHVDRNRCTWYLDDLIEYLDEEVFKTLRPDLKYLLKACKGI